MQLRELKCDVCGTNFPMDADEEKKQPALFGVVKGYVMKTELQSDKSTKPVLKEYSADCCPDCWKKVYDNIITIQK